MSTLQLISQYSVRSYGTTSSAGSARPSCMKLVEPEAEGPIEGEEPIVTAPRPPHRRVSVSFLFTLTVLIGTVVAIYVVFPARHNLILTEAIEQHRETEVQWDIAAPSAAELRLW